MSLGKDSFDESKRTGKTSTLRNGNMVLEGYTKQICFETWDKSLHWCNISEPASDVRAG